MASELRDDINAKLHKQIKMARKAKLKLKCNKKQSSAKRLDKNCVIGIQAIADQAS